MAGRGQRQHYNPITQVPELIGEAQDLTRIEFFPDGDGKWHGRKINAQGGIEATSPGAFDHGTALAEAESIWPGIPVYEIREESDDSTWEGVGPSPRRWGSGAQPPAPAPEREALTQFAEDVLENGVVPWIAPEADAPEPMQVRGLNVEPGQYLHRDDVVVLLESYAAEYDSRGNPSGALALREAAEALR